MKDTQNDISGIFLAQISTSMRENWFQAALQLVMANYEQKKNVQFKKSKKQILIRK